MPNFDKPNLPPQTQEIVPEKKEKMTGPEPESLKLTEKQTEPTKKEMPDKPLAGTINKDIERARNAAILASKLDKERGNHDLIMTEFKKNNEEYKRDFMGYSLRAIYNKIMYEEREKELLNSFIELEKEKDNSLMKIKGLERQINIISLTKELAERGEIFPFYGIDQKVYSSMKADEAEYPGITTPIDELIGRFQNEGMKVVIGKHPESANIFILPAKSDDIENDMVFAKNFLINETMPDNLKKLIRLDVERARGFGK